MSCPERAEILCSWIFLIDPLEICIQGIQGHKRCLTDEDRKRLRQSIDNRHHKTTVANGSIMMCEVQGAKEDFIRRWNLVFKDYPDVFEDNDCRSAILFLIDDTSAYLQTIKERVL